MAFSDCANAADGLNAGFSLGSREWLVFVHQDVFLPSGWVHCLSKQLHEAKRRFGPIGVAGVRVGKVIAPAGRSRPLAAPRVGWVIDCGRELPDGPELPAQVANLDELLLFVRRDSGLRFDATLGNPVTHLRGAFSRPASRSFRESSHPSSRGS